MRKNNSEINNLIKQSNRFLGYGDLKNAKIVYFGIEEHGNFESINQFNKWISNKSGYTFESIYLNGSECFYQKEDKTKADRPVKGPTENQQAILSYKLLKFVFKETTKISLDDYLYSYYIKNENNVFTANVFPLGAPSVKALSNLHVELGYINKNSYYNDVWGDREKVMMNFIKYFIDKILCKEDIYLFHFGTEVFYRLKPIYEVLGITITDDKYYSYSADKKIWFCYHPAARGKYRFNLQIIDEIIGLLI